MRAAHWTALARLISIYTLEWFIDGAESHDEAAWLIMMHRSCGLTVLLPTLFRFGWRPITRVRALPDSVRRPQRVAAKAVVIALYPLLLLQPPLGLIASQLHGDHLEVFGLFALPLFMAPNRALSKQICDLHGTMALVRGGDVLHGMLPALRHGATRRDLSEI